MKIFIDSADINEIKEAFSWGIVDGVTTNPSLIRKAIQGKKVRMENYIQELLATAKNKPVSLEIDGESAGKITQEQMVKEATNLFSKFSQFNSNLNIKIPVNPAFNPEDLNQFDGLKAIRQLQEKNIPVNATLLMTPEQALLAAKAGASYLSPFLGRIDDYTKDGKDNQGISTGIELMQETMALLRNYNFNMEVIGASVRSIEHVRELGKLGVEIATIPFSILKQMIAHEKTYQGVRKFKEDMVPEYSQLLRG